MSDDNNLQTEEDLDRLRTATHEAGHAVAA